MPALLLIAFSPFSLTNIDSTRDYIMAYRIAVGESWPLLGPKLAFSFHIGPWWFYLMALPALITKSWLGMAVTVAILNACKFYLAFRVGCLIKNRQMGICMVTALMMVSMTYMQTITFTHTSLVETCMFLMLFYAYKTDLKHLKHWLVFGLLTALTFHSHPTAILIGYFAIPKWYSAPNKIVKLLAFIGSFTLLLSPMIYSESLQAGGISSYFSKQSIGFAWLDLPKLLYGLWVTGPMGMLSINLPFVIVTLVLILQLLLQFTAASLPFFFINHTSPQVKKFYLHSWGFFLLSCIGLLLIRDTTPWYMTYGLSLGFSLIIASGLFIVFQKYNQAKLQKSTVFGVLLIFVVVNISYVPLMQNSQIRIPGASLNDLKAMSYELSDPGFEFTAWQASLHGQFTCSQQPVSIHGPYAALVFTHSGIEHLRQCGQALYYGPSKHNSHLIGVPEYFQKHIKQLPIKQIGQVYFYKPKDIATPQTSWQENYQHDYERHFPTLPNWKNQTVQTELKSGRNLLVTKLIGFKMHTEIKSVSANGVSLKPVVKNNYSSLYQCLSCNPEQVSWKITYQESVNGMTNTVSF